MKTGKISEAVLKRSVLKQIKNNREEVILGAEPFEDAAILALADDEHVICSIDSFTYVNERSCSYAIFSAINDISAMGAEPVAVLISALLPINIQEPQIKGMMKDLQQACETAQVVAIGGHTEVTDSVNKALLTITALGKVKKDKEVLTKGAVPGLDLVVTKWIGLEGTCILANEQEEKLRTRFPMHLIEEAQSFKQYLSAVAEAATAVKSDVHAMHDVSQGGIFAALWEMAQASGVGLEIDLKSIPIRQETIEICEFFSLNPYELVSGGSMLIAVENGYDLVRELQKQGIHSAVIGKTTGGNDRIIINEEERRFLEPAKPDCIHQILEN